MKKISLYLSAFFIVLIVAVYFIFWPKTRLNLAAEATGGFPYQIGLTGVTVTQCYTSCPAPVVPTCCMGGTLCTMKTVAQCVLYSDVMGSPSGGMGSNAIFSNINLGIAGVSSGGQLIAGGSTMTEMDSGVLAGMGGCAGVGCAAVKDKNIFERYYEIIKYGIASFKD